MPVNKDRESSIVKAYELYNSLSVKPGKEKDKLTDVYLSKREDKLIFISKSSLRGRISSIFSKNSLNYEKNLETASKLFLLIDKASEAELNKATEALKKQSKSNANLTPDEVLKTINKLKDFLLDQKDHVEEMRSGKGIDTKKLWAITISPISSKAFTNKAQKTSGKIQNFFKENTGYREGQIRNKLLIIDNLKLFNKPFPDDQIQEIVSFLSTYLDTPEVLEQLINGNSDPFHLAMMKALSFASEAHVETIIEIIENIKSSKIAGEALTGQNPLELRNFGMVFGDSFIKDSGLEGEKTGTVYVDLAAEYYKHKGLANSPEENALQDTLSHRINLDSKDKPADIRKKIKDQLSRSLQNPKKCVLIGGWMTHGLVYEVEQQKNGKLTFRIYNEGEGIQYHDNISDKYKTKYAGCIGIKDIPEKLFFKRSFIASLQGLATLSGSICDKQPIDLLVGHLLPMLGGNQETSADRVQQFLSPQKSGTCTYRSTLAFLAHSMSKDEYKIFKLDFKLYMLSLYYPELQKAVQEPVDAKNYEERQLELSTIRRSIEKFSEGIKKLKESIPPEKIKEARDKILIYESKLKKLEQGILKYEKQLYSKALAEDINLTKPASFYSQRGVVVHVNEGQSEALISQLKANRLSRQACEPAIALINTIPTDRNSPEFSTQIEKCIFAFSNLVNNKSINENEKIVIASQFFQKIRNINAWDKILFSSPRTIQKELKNLTDKFGALIDNTLSDHKAERVCIYFSFCYALEKASKQLSKEFIIIDLPEKSAVNTSENQSLLKSLRTSDPFWVKYIEEMTHLNEPGLSLSLFSEGTLLTGKTVLSNDIATQIGRWRESENCAPMREVMKISIASDRKLQTEICENIKKKYGTLKENFDNTCTFLKIEIDIKNGELKKLDTKNPKNQPPLGLNYASYYSLEESNSVLYTNFIASSASILKGANLAHPEPKFTKEGDFIYVKYEIQGSGSLIFRVDSSGNLNPGREAYLSYVQAFSKNREIKWKEQALEETNKKRENLGIDEAREIKAVWDNLEYWPKGFENLPHESGKTEAFKASFLFLDQPNFIKSKFNKVNIDEALKKFPGNSKAKENLYKIKTSGDFLPEEFRAFIDCSLLCQEITHKKHEMPIIPQWSGFNTHAFDRLSFINTLLDRNSQDVLVLNNEKNSFDNNKFDFFNEDFYYKDIKNPDTQMLYKTLCRNKGISETDQPQILQSLDKDMQRVI
ncbi:MAG: hypothetical protein H0X29_09685, partial [Parachlamydiaceae bacterium]|nr:hypothetical protein [Parachlamydiaceae bacterium]